MSIYKKLQKFGSRFMGTDKLLKMGFNYMPMYRRSTARLTYVSSDLLRIVIKLPISYKNRNYMNSIFGGSMFSAVDPIPMIQLVNLLGDDYVIWDKSAEIFFKRPAKEDLYADFVFTNDEVDSIKKMVKQNNEIEVIKTTQLTNKDKSKVFCEINKKIYISEKQFYKAKLEAKRLEKM